MIDILNPQDEEWILDVGCGSGELTNEISQRGAYSIGFDADPNMIQRAKELFPQSTFFQADARNFRLPSSIIAAQRRQNDVDDKDRITDDDNIGDGNDGTETTTATTATTTQPQVDAIFSNAALHWVTDAEMAVAAMSRVLKPGGRFVVEFGGKGNVAKIVNASLEVLNGRSTVAPGSVSKKREDETRNSQQKTYTNPWYFPSIGEYTSLLEIYDIEVTSAILFDRPTLLEEGDLGMRNWLQMFGGALLRDDDDDDIDVDDVDPSASTKNKNNINEMDDVLDEIIAKLRHELYDGQQWTADYRRIRLVGQKKMID